MEKFYQQLHQVRLDGSFKSEVLETVQKGVTYRQDVFSVAKSIASKGKLIHLNQYRNIFLAKCNVHTFLTTYFPHHT